MKTVKLSELSAETMVFPEDGYVIEAQDLVTIAKENGTTQNWYVGIPAVWTPNAESMLDSYIENESCEMYENADEAMWDKIKPLVPQLKAILDTVKVGYYECGAQIEIDIEMDSQPSVRDGRQ